MERVKHHLRRMRRAAYRPIAAAHHLSFWQKMVILIAAVILCATIDYALNYRRDRSEPARSADLSLEIKGRGNDGTGSWSSRPITCAQKASPNDLSQRHTRS